jgi:mRNA-degrading endonuclease RelE of RelBE toxin-antitoxin system
MAFLIEVTGSAGKELQGIRPFDRKRIVSEIDTQLRHEPTTATKNRKCLEALSPTFEHVPPVWELRVGEYRVFYDVDSDGEKVFIRAVRRKLPEQTTGEVVS